MQKTGKEIISSIPVYLCDPDKNNDCRKTSCHKTELYGMCYLTSKKECALYDVPFRYGWRRDPYEDI